MKFTTSALFELFEKGTNVVGSTSVTIKDIIMSKCNSSFRKKLTEDDTVNIIENLLLLFVSIRES
jgi:hypothetical protein